jgi:hypothetical protein
LKTPEFANGARKSLELRGDGGTGWSKGWKINVWARLLDGNHAYKLIREQLTLTGVEGTTYTNGGGTYPNMLDAHPPFQIDGNFGGASGITEMLVQSHLGEVHLLPAIPDAWMSGEVKGLRARGGFEVNLTWTKNKLKQATLRSDAGKTCTIRSNYPFTVKGISAKVIADHGGYIANVSYKKRKRLYNSWKINCTPMRRKSLEFLPFIFTCLAITAGAQTVTLKVETGKAGIVQPTMWGIFFEDINFAADGGLYAELVKNRSFEFTQPMAGWQLSGIKQVFNECQVG